MWSNGTSFVVSMSCPCLVILFVLFLFYLMEYLFQLSVVILSVYVCMWFVICRRHDLSMLFIVVHVLTSISCEHFCLTISAVSFGACHSSSIDVWWTSHQFVSTQLLASERTKPKSGILYFFSVVFFFLLLSFLIKNACREPTLTSYSIIFFFFEFYCCIQCLFFTLFTIKLMRLPHDYLSFDYFFFLMKNCILFIMSFFPYCSHGLTIIVQKKADRVIVVIIIVIVVA